MNDHVPPPAFSVVPGSAVARVLTGHEEEVIEVIRQAYRLHGTGSTVNPPSYFLRFPDAPGNRIIALPASVGGEVSRAGLKWISSFPGNLERGIPRASAVLVLNDLETGYPVACLESSILSAARTAASAALAARVLSEGRAPIRSVGFVGTGLIARHVLTYLKAAGVDTSEIGVFDQSEEYARNFAEVAEVHGRVRVHADAESLVRSSDLVVFATTAGTPHVERAEWFDHHPLVLHLSLRDLGRAVVEQSFNIVDDVEHCLKADTSLHLVEQQTGNRDHVAGTLHEVIDGQLPLPAGRTVVFSPFGLGVLDIALAHHVHGRVVANGDVTYVEDFFHELDRYVAPPVGVRA